jgi:hypothetical protein
MFGKDKTYRQVSFPAEVIEAAVSEFMDILRQAEDEINYTMFSYESGDDEQTTITDSSPYDRRQGFHSNSFFFRLRAKKSSRFFSIMKHGYALTVRVEDVPNISEADRLLQVFNQNHGFHKVPTEEALKKVAVFLGHGRSPVWRDLKEHLQDLHGVKVTAYETGARAGYTIQEVLQELSSEASMAFLVHTGEDIDRDGQAHARENVVHETGLLQGKLGFKRAIVLLEDGCNEFSNISGLQQLRFAKGNIKEVFGDVLAVLRREFTNGD